MSVNLAVSPSVRLRVRPLVPARLGRLGCLLWKLWSPTWNFDNETYNRTLHHSTIVTLSIWSFTLIGIVWVMLMADPRYATLEARLASLPKISVPTIVFHGAGVLGSSLIEEQEHGPTPVGVTE
jgi:hypothetical protein